MSKTTLPQFLVVEGTTYQLEIEDITDGDFAGWTCVRYVNESRGGIPFPSVRVGGFIEYLVSMCPSKEDAVTDMKRKVRGGDMTKNYNTVGI